MDLCTDAVLPVETELARIAIYVDDLTEPVRIVILRTPCVHITVPISDGTQMKTVRIMRWTEAAFALSGIRNLQTEPGSRVQSTKPKAHHIEFIGDSITCGYGVEAESPATFSTATENPALAYAILTANALNADFSLVAWSGIGLISSWVDATIEEPNQTLLMSKLYPYHQLRLSERLGVRAEFHDFASDPADLVIINLGTNDTSWTRGIPEREALFASAYTAFLDQVHLARPETPILAVLGTMAQSLCDIIKHEISVFQALHPNTPAHFLQLPLQKPEDGLGADGHPTPATQRIAANHLIAAIEDLHLW